MATSFDKKSEAARNEFFKLYHEVVDPMNDGFLQWEYKKSLIELKYMIDNMLSTCSNFGSIEEEYVNQKEQEKVIRILKK